MACLLQVMAAAAGTVLGLLVVPVVVVVLVYNVCKIVRSWQGIFAIGRLEISAHRGSGDTYATLPGTTHVWATGPTPCLLLCPKLEEIARIAGIASETCCDDWRRQNMALTLGVS